jgi:hypothetical protein
MRGRAAADTHACSLARSDIRNQLSMVRDRLDALPLPGSGHTSERWDALAEVAATSLSLARLAEAHADAVAICAEAGRLDVVTGTFGVWASDGPESRVEAVPARQGFKLVGIKRFCSGSSLVDRALVTAHAPDGLRLFAVNMDDPSIEVDVNAWATAAFAETETGTVRFDLHVPSTDVVGAPGFYLHRPGFWHGAVGVAACWAGGGMSLVRRYRDHYRRDDAHSLAHLGAMEAACWAMMSVLHTAAAEIDADPFDLSARAHLRALALRHVVEQNCRDVLARLARAAGPRLAAFDPWFAQQCADLSLYLQQCHGERDLEAIGRDSVSTNLTLKTDANGAARRSNHE